MIYLVVYEKDGKNEVAEVQATTLMSAILAFQAGNLISYNKIIIITKK